MKVELPGTILEVGHKGVPYFVAEIEECDAARCASLIMGSSKTVSALGLIKFIATSQNIPLTEIIDYISTPQPEDSE